jgi:concentrative nucleoside transporter, CNT family
MERLMPMVGLVTMMLIAWGLSSHRNRFPWRIVVCGILLQIALAVLVLWDPSGGDGWVEIQLGRSLWIPTGKTVFGLMGDGITNLLDSVDHGAAFVFGANAVTTESGPTPAYKVHFVAFKVLPTIIFFSALMSVLYYIGLMQLVVGAISRIMQRTLGTSGAETLSTAGNIFVGQTEAPLLVKPYLNRMTDSEIMAVMVGGFATIAGGVMAAYVGMGIEAVHLLSASLMAAPATLVIAKIMQPEVDVPETLGKVQEIPPMEATNIIDAAARGASDGLHLALNVGAMLIAFLGLIFMLDGMLGSVTGAIGYRITFTEIMGYISAPFAFLMGIELKDCWISGKILGTRIVGNEFIAYLQMNVDINPEFASVSERTKTIMTYALCGFANVGSIGIQIGGLGPLAPDRRGALVRLGLRAMIGGLLACYMTACLAAVFI